MHLEFQPLAKSHVAPSTYKQKSPLDCLTILGSKYSQKLAVIQDFVAFRLGSWFHLTYANLITQASLVAQRLKRLPATWETQVRSLGREDPLEKEMATHSSILAWRIPWTEEPGRLQRVVTKSQTRLSNFTHSTLLLTPHMHTNIYVCLFIHTLI